MGANLARSIEDARGPRACCLDDRAPRRDEVVEAFANTVAEAEATPQPEGSERVAGLAGLATAHHRSEQLRDGLRVGGLRAAGVDAAKL